jgi:protease I
MLLFLSETNLMAELDNKKIAILATDGFEYVELIEPKRALEEAGAETEIVSPKDAEITGWDNDRWHDAPTPVDRAVAEASAEDYDGLLLPGGVINPDRLRLSEESIDFIREFVDADKPIAAICHGPWTLINAEGVEDKTVTSWPSLEVDLINAGADWVDKEVVRDGNLVTSRKPEDIPAFNEEIIQMFSES